MMTCACVLGGHLLSFLSNLETGLLPHGQLDPPLWSQRGTGKVCRNNRTNFKQIYYKI